MATSARRPADPLSRWINWFSALAPDTTVKPHHRSGKDRFSRFMNAISR